MGVEDGVGSEEARALYPPGFQLGDDDAGATELGVDDGALAYRTGAGDQDGIEGAYVRGLHRPERGSQPTPGHRRVVIGDIVGDGGEKPGGPQTVLGIGPRGLSLSREVSVADLVLAVEEIAGAAVGASTAWARSHQDDPVTHLDTAGLGYLDDLADALVPQRRNPPALARPVEPGFVLGAHRHDGHFDQRPVRFGVGNGHIDELGLLLAGDDGLFH